MVRRSAGWWTAMSAPAAGMMTLRSTATPDQGRDKLRSVKLASTFVLASGRQMENQGLAVHRAIVVVDVEGFGDRRRTNAHQVAVRDGLYRVMCVAFGRAGISWGDCGREDRGDGVLVLVPAEVPKGLLADS